MYIRFVLPQLASNIRVELGLFHEAYDLKRNKKQVPKWLRKELKRELKWFDNHLNRPKRSCLHFKRRRSIYGLCWFQPEAHEHITRARYTAWLMTEAGEPVREIRTRAPGQILWRDQHQIVAKPSVDLPRAF